MAFTAKIQRVTQCPSRDRKQCVSSVGSTAARGQRGQETLITATQHQGATFLSARRSHSGDSTSAHNSTSILDPALSPFMQPSGMGQDAIWLRHLLPPVLSPIFILRDQPISKTNFSGWVTSSPTAISHFLVGTDASGHIVGLWSLKSSLDGFECRIHGDS